jgi:hypothetical protein
MIQSKGISQLTRADPQYSVSVFLEKVIQLLVERSRVCMDGDEGISQIKLKDTVRTIERAVQFCVDDEVIASDVVRRAGTGFDIGTALTRNEQKFFSLSDWIPNKTEFFDQFF